MTVSNDNILHISQSGSSKWDPAKKIRIYSNGGDCSAGNRKLAIKLSNDYGGNLSSSSKVVRISRSQTSVVTTSGAADEAAGHNANNNCKRKKNFVTVVQIGQPNPSDETSRVTRSASLKTAKSTELNAVNDRSFFRSFPDFSNGQDDPDPLAVKEITKSKELLRSSQSSASSVEEDIAIYRLPHEKLGLGLKFKGGSKSRELVHRLFIHFCHPESPASRTFCSWGKIQPGDEITVIEGKPINTMTRVECVNALKDSPIAVKMRIKHFFEPNKESSSVDKWKKNCSTGAWSKIVSRRLQQFSQNSLPTLQHHQPSPHRANSMTSLNTKSNQHHLKESAWISKSDTNLAYLNEDFHDSRDDEELETCVDSLDFFSTNVTNLNEDSGIDSIYDVPRMFKPNRQGDFTASTMKSMPPRAEVYTNLLNEDTEFPDSLNVPVNHVSMDVPIKRIEGKTVDSDADTDSTESTIQSRKITPASSFSAADVGIKGPASSRDMSLKLLIDPFEQLEREFQADLSHIRPPSDFGDFTSNACTSNTFVEALNDDIMDRLEPSLGSCSSSSCSDEDSLCCQESVGVYEVRDAEKNFFLVDKYKNSEPMHVSSNPEVEKNLRQLKVGSYLTLGRSKKDSSYVRPSYHNIAEKMDTIAEPVISLNPSPIGMIHRQVKHSMSQDSNDGSSSGAGSSGTLNLIIPPTHSRLPPDGHEFPPDYKEPFMSQHQLSRKSSASSTGSVSAKNSNLNLNGNSNFLKTSLRRNDEQCMKSVKDKIALFSSGSKSTLHHQSTEDVMGKSAMLHPRNSNQQMVGGYLQRAYTHGDVRVDNGPSTDRLSSKGTTINGRGNSTSYHRSMVNVSDNYTRSRIKNDNRKVNLKSVSSADLLNGINGSRGGRGSHDFSKTLDSDGRRRFSVTQEKSRQIRSQSLLEIGAVRSSESTLNQTLPKRSSVSIKDIPDKNDLSQAKQIDLNLDKSILNNDKNNDTVVSNRSPNDETAKKKSVSKSEDPRILKKNSVEALNRRAVLEACKRSDAGGTNSMSLLSSSSTKRTSSITEFRAIESKALSSTSRLSTGGFSKRDSDISLGKPASRSSSFTIAERKKSFESLASKVPTEVTSSSHKRPLNHSSQDCLTSSSSRRERETLFEKFDNSFSGLNSSVRSSRDTIGEEIEEDLQSSSRRSSRSEADGGSRVTTPTKSDRSSSVTPTEVKVSRNNSSNCSHSPESPSKKSSDLLSNWPGVEKKFSVSSTSSASSSSSTKTISGDTKAKIAQYSDLVERPKDLSIGSTQSTSSYTSTASSPVKKLSTSSNPSETIRQLTEKFERNEKISQAKTSPFGKNTLSFDTQTAVKESDAITPVNEFQKSFSEFTKREMNDSESSDDSFSTKAKFRLGEWPEANDTSPMYFPEESTEWESFDPSVNNFFTPISSSSPQTYFHHHYRKFSVPVQSSSHSARQAGNSGNGGLNSSEIRYRDKKEKNAAPSRPSSLIESDSMKFEEGHLGNRSRHNLDESASTSRGSSQADLLAMDVPDTIVHSASASVFTNSSSATSMMMMMSSSSSTSKSSFKSVTSTNQEEQNRRCISVNDIRRAFEKAEQSLSKMGKVCSPSSSSGGLSAPSHNRMSSLDSTNSDESSIPNTPHYYGSVSSLLSGQTNVKDHYGSISSLASSTSLISPQELQGLIDEANQSLEESGTPSHEIMVIVLHREFAAGSIGITLAGGADYENKDITVHKVIPGTLADRDGRIQKGDRVLSINGRSTKGVTHREALSILKAPRAEVVLVLSRSRSVTPAELGYDRSPSNVDNGNYPASYSYVNMGSGRPPKILESPLDSKSLLSDLKFVDVPRGPPMTVLLKKEGTGLGFSLEGGKDSPLGDRPLTIKKIFSGGAADKSGILKVGDEILSVNNADCTRMSRIEAWNFMKKLSDGTATLVVKQKLESLKGSHDKETSQADSSTSANKSPNAVNTVGKVEQGAKAKLEESKHI